MVVWNFKGEEGNYSGDGKSNACYAMQRQLDTERTLVFNPCQLSPTTPIPHSL